MIYIPNIRPETVKNLEVDFGSSISVSIWLKIINNQNWVEKNLPIGALLFFYRSMTKADLTPIELPNSNIWIELNGQTVNDIKSPLNGQILPDLRDKFLKGSETYGLTGGQTTLNLVHSHGGLTGITDDREEKNADEGNAYNTGSPHYHVIGQAWSSAEPIIPKFFSVQTYMRFK